MKNTSDVAEKDEENVDDLKRNLQGSLVSLQQASDDVIDQAASLARSARRSSTPNLPAVQAPPAKATGAGLTGKFQALKAASR